MIDMDGKEIKLDNLIECFNLGFEEINKLIDGITQLAKLTNNTKYEVFFFFFFNLFGHKTKMKN